MMNFEFYKDEILEACDNGKLRAFILDKACVDLYVLYSEKNMVKWLYEEHTILADKERKYLSQFIEPFKNSVISITKRNYSDRYEHLEFITTEPYGGRLNFTLPLFREGTMYKAMELHKAYTPEELGL